MSNHEEIIILRPSQQLRRAGWRRIIAKIRNVMIVLVAAVVFLLVIGVPHIGYDYRYRMVGRERQKINMDYWSVTGKKVYGRGSEADKAGFPIVIFVPVSECVDFESVWADILRRVGLS